MIEANSPQANNDFSLRYLLLLLLYFFSATLQAQICGGVANALLSPTGQSPAPRADDRSAQFAGQALSRYAVDANGFPSPPSQRLSKTKSTGEVAKEATYINRSLSFLEQVTGALSEKGREHVPYRSSKLTHVLKDSLGGNCQTVMIATVWGEAVHLRETLSTLKFASRMARVSNEVSVNVRQVREKGKRKTTIYSLVQICNQSEHISRASR
jgi:hypothetical protein